jgi:hypothetical protein
LVLLLLRRGLPIAPKELTSRNVRVKPWAGQNPATHGFFVFCEAMVAVLPWLFYKRLRRNKP